jgi:hypothetical protein
MIRSPVSGWVGKDGEIVESAQSSSSVFPSLSLSLLNQVIVRNWVVCRCSSSSGDCCGSSGCCERRSLCNQRIIICDINMEANKQ